MSQQAYLLTVLLAAAVTCAAAMGYAIGRLRGRTRLSGVNGQHSNAVLASALEDGLSHLKAQQRAMSERAEASERLNSHIVASLTAGLLLIDRNGMVELLNPAGRKLLGFSGEPAGTAFETALASAAPLVELITECRRTRSAIVRRTVTVTRPSGSVHLGVTVSPLDEVDRGGVICLFSDLTTVVEMEDRLRLKDALARLGELTAGLAHEFRNGLATIHGYARLLDPEVLPAAYRPYVGELRRETEQLGQVVTKFLDFAKPEQLSFSPVSLEEVARRAADDIRNELPPGTTINLSGAFGDIDGDEQLLKQAFDNLYRNAAEASARAERPAAIVVSGAFDASAGTARIRVDDNGPGIPESERARVFQPFFTTRASGTGLGLALVQKIVLAHNGSVSVAASASGGARLELTFPLALSAHAASR
jgi:two-component system sensor histidine kinase AtoS